MRNPVTQDVVAKSPLSTEAEFNSAVEAASTAFKSWSTTPILTRQRYIFDLAAVIRRDIDKLAARIT